MFKIQYFLAAPNKYKRIWLEKVLEASLRGHVEKKFKDLVHDLCGVFGFNYNKILRTAILNYNKKATALDYVKGTILNIQFRYFYVRSMCIKFCERIFFKIKPFLKFFSKR